MTKREQDIKKELERMTEHVETLEQKIKQLETENSMSSTSGTQKEANSFMIEQCYFTIKMLKSKKQYLLLGLNEPKQQQSNLYNELMVNGVKITPNSLLQS